MSLTEARDEDLRLLAGHLKKLAEGGGPKAKSARAMLADVNKEIKRREPPKPKPKPKPKR